MKNENIKIVETKILNMRKKGSTRLDLSNCQLTYLPYITKLNNVTELNLSFNNLEAITNDILKLKQLSVLILNFNKLKELPSSILELRNLQRLELYGNQLIELPQSITKLSFLRILNLSVNLLIDLPVNISKLKYLTVFNLGGNQIESLPSSFSNLQNLTKLDLSSNQLKKIPKCILKLHNLRILNLSNNKITEIPKNLTKLKSLKNLNLNNNPIQIPPPEVIQKGISEINEYYRQLKEVGKDYLYEAKFIILGESGSGKTTFAKKIENINYQLQEREPSTEGIDIIRCGFKLTNGNLFRMNIWDFGGQEIYHATHQFFLTKRSLYALVCDNRKEDTDFNYWLNIIKLLSGNSPLLIIKNEKHNRKRVINEKSLQRKYENLKEIMSTNLSTNIGLIEIIEKVKQNISILPHIGCALPTNWVNVRKKLKSFQKNYIPITEYLNICEQHGFTKVKDKYQLSMYLHDIGICLHFQEDPILKNVLILNPEWATEAVYKILDNKDIRIKFGKFNKFTLKRIWNETQYYNMHDELLQLMLKFDLCYEIPGSKGYFIAPQLLGDNQLSYKWPDKHNLVTIYKYEFMPKGIILRFIVTMHMYICKQKFVWKSGVVLVPYSLSCLKKRRSFKILKI